MPSVPDPEIETHYDRGVEQPRLAREASLEWVRTQELLLRYLPAPPAAILDVGGGPGVYAGWLAERGYAVRLVDPVARHVAEARAAADAQAGHPFTAALGDARQLEEIDDAFDAVLLMGPLYHLVESRDRLQALREAHRVVRPGGRVLGTAISRFASLLDGLLSGWLSDPVFQGIVAADLRTGWHRNPEPDRHPEWFTTAYFHRPEELAAEVRGAGLRLEALLNIEGPGWLVWRDLWDDPARRAGLVEAARAVEAEPSLLGCGAHLLAVARRDPIPAAGQARQTIRRLPHEIRTARLVLRVPRADDAAAIFQAYAQDPEGSRYLAWRPNRSLTETQQFVDCSAAAWNRGFQFPG